MDLFYTHAAFLQGLAELMGPQLLEHTAGLQPLLQQRVCDAVTVASSKQ
jgi:hypothetical protein